MAAANRRVAMAWEAVTRQISWKGPGPGDTYQVGMSTDEAIRQRLATATRRPPRRRRGAKPRGQDLLDGPSCLPDVVGDPEGRVYGGRLLAAVLPFSPGSSSHHPPQQHCREEVTSAAVGVAEPEQSLASLLDDIERSIVVPVCRNAGAMEYFPDHTRRLANYLAAARNLRMLSQHTAVLPGRLHGRAASLLHTAMGALTMEFCSLNIWRPDSLRVCSPASMWESVRCSSTADGGGSASTTDSSGNSLSGGGSGGNYGSFGTYDMALGDERTVQSGEESSRMMCIDLNSLRILDGIAGVMIEAGDERTLRESFHRHSAQLTRRIEILDIDNVLGKHTKESIDMVRKVWTSAMLVNIGVLADMRRQLTVTDFGSFNPLKEDYFCSIAKLSVMKLLSSASSICNQLPLPNYPSSEDSHEAMKQHQSKMANLVMMYQSLNCAMPEIVALFRPGQTTEFISAEVRGTINGLAAAFLKLVAELNYFMRSQCLVITDTGVHRFTRHIMDHLGLLAQQKHTLYLMLKDNPDEFRALVTKLVASLLIMVDKSSRSLRLQGQKELFLLNNLHFVLQEAHKHMDLEMVLGERWFSEHRDRLDWLVTEYVEASWQPVMSSFETRPGFVRTMLWPHEVFDKFRARFKMTYSDQKAWKVTDPVIRRKLREAIALKVIPPYRMQMESFLEMKHKSAARYSIEQLESQLRELFEG